MRLHFKHAAYVFAIGGSIAEHLAARQASVTLVIMAVEFNHTIVHARNREESANFYHEVFALPLPFASGPFLVVKTANGVYLDIIETDQPIEPQHYAFSVTEKEFDEIYSRVKARGLTCWSDPGRRAEGTYQYGGGRGVYFLDPGGNFLEILTYGRT